MRIDYLFKAGCGYDSFILLVQSNPRFVFYVDKQDSVDRRTRKAKMRGWSVLRHRRHAGTVKMIKKDGVCWTELKDSSGGRQLSGAWLAWIASNASEIVSGVDVRFD